MPISKTVFIHSELRDFGTAPRRKVHLDFHNSAHIPSIGANFNPEEFWMTLSNAGVDAVVVFAKDMHGFFYYPSERGPVHPGLSFDLLGGQVDACNERGIKTYAYYCTLWDHELARAHPEWLMRKRDGSTFMPAPDETPGWTGLCCAHEELVQLMESHTEEILTRYEVDGIWFDMPIPRDSECFCSLCQRQMRAAGLDPYDVSDQRNWQHANHFGFIQRLYAQAQKTRPGCQVDFNNQGMYRLPDRMFAMNSVDIEALPTAQWGYDYFPAVVRYARAAGAKTYGMTGRFHGSWADFGGLKQAHQLAGESMAIVAQGSSVDIGDQMPPDGRLDPAVYEAIGSAFGEVGRAEPYLVGAAPVAECILLADGFPLDSVATPSVSGWVKALQQLHIQSDVGESSWDWSRYPLVIITSDCPYSPELAARLESHLYEGGEVLIANESWGDWLAQIGFGSPKSSEFNPAYFIPSFPSQALAKYEYAIYGPSWTLSSASKVIASLGEPLFQRSPEHYTSHEQTPVDHDTGLAVAGSRRNVGFLGFDLGELYLRTGYWAYIELLDQVLEAVHPERVVRTDTGPTVQVEIAHQGATNLDSERFMAHLVHWEVMRPSSKHAPYLAKSPRIGPIKITLNVGRPILRALSVRLGCSLEFDGDAYILPEMTGHDIISFELMSPI